MPEPLQSGFVRVVEGENPKRERARESVAGSLYQPRVRKRGARPVARRETAAGRRADGSRPAENDSGSRDPRPGTRNLPESASRFAASFGQSMTATMARCATSSLHEGCGTRSSGPARPTRTAPRRGRPGRHVDREVLKAPVAHSLRGARGRGSGRVRASEDAEREQRRRAGEGARARRLGVRSRMACARRMGALAREVRSPWHQIAPARFKHRVAVHELARRAREARNR